ncbi:MAG: 50S ribosomal protein L23 [Acidobacteriota bacterium]
MNIYEVIRHPRVTEKSAAMQERGQGRVLTFQVRKDASKHQIRAAVEKIFEVKVAKIRTCNYLGKVKRQGRYSGRRPSWKKAYVTLKPGEKPVEFYEGV